MQRRRCHRRVLALGATLVALLVTPSIASADCGDAIVDEVFNTGSVDGAYALRCYDLAITKLEGDAAEYSEARGIISSAKIVRRNQLAAEQQDDGQAQPDPPRSDSAEPGSDGQGGDGNAGGGAGPSEDGGAQAEEPADEELTAEAEDASTDATTDELSEEDVTTAAAPASFDDGDDGGGPSLPVLLLGGLAIAMIAVGAGGMVWRRLNP